MANFEIAHKITAKWEGGISDHPADRGGYTAYGVSEEFLKDLYSSASGRVFLDSLGLGSRFDKELMKKKLTRDLAARIFRFHFWDGQGIGGFESQALATVYYDASVNHGKGGATKMLQQALNNKAGARLAVDGAIGPKTRAALPRNNDGKNMDAALEFLRIRENFFRNLVYRRPSQKVFLKGWLNRNADLSSYIKTL